MYDHVKQLWKEQLEAVDKGGISKLLRALDNTRRYLRQKGKEVAADRRRREDKLREQVSELQRNVEAQSGDQSADAASLKAAKLELKKLEMGKARGWAKRAKLKWAVEGDSPTKFF